MELTKANNSQGYFLLMNILFVSSNFPPEEGGIAIFNCNICKQLSGRGHKVLTLVDGFKESNDFDKQQSFDILRFNGRIRPTSLKAIYKILSLVLKNRIEVIFFGHFGSTHWLGGVLAKKILKVPYVILVHGTEFNSYFDRFTWADHWASKIVLRNASRIIANSRATKKLVEDHGYSSKKIRIVHPGTDPVKFKVRDKQMDLMEKFGLKDKKILLTVSRLVAKKNHENVLKALPLVIQKIPNFIYLIIGKGEEEVRLKKLAKDLGLEKYVQFVGYVEPKDVAVYYNICDIFVMPSKTVDIDYESFGIVYAEANACGKPVIGGKSGGVEDAVIDGVTGLLVNPDNVEEISQALLCLLTDQEHARELGENGRRRVKEELNWASVGRKIEEILQETVTATV